MSEEVGLGNANKVSYNIDPVYISKYDDVYNSEEYFEMMELIDEVRTSVIAFCEVNPQFDFIRKLDVEFIKAGDEIEYEDRVVTVNTIEGNNMICRCGREKLVVPKCAIVKNESKLNKIKNNEISMIYMGTKELMSKSFSDIKYFSTICDYLKLVPTLVWQALPFPERARLYAELSNSESNLLKNKVKKW